MSEQSQPKRTAENKNRSERNSSSFSSSLSSNCLFYQPPSPNQRNNNNKRNRLAFRRPVNDEESNICDFFCGVNDTDDGGDDACGRECWVGPLPTNSIMHEMCECDGNSSMGVQMVLNRMRT